MTKLQIIKNKYGNDYVHMRKIRLLEILKVYLTEFNR